MALSQRIVSGAYFAIHQWVVQYTNAYQVLFEDIGVLLDRAGVGQAAHGLLVPTSSGDVLRVVEDRAISWAGVDIDAKCLDCCADIVSAGDWKQADLNETWPCPRSRFDLAISIHALHYLDSDRLIAGVFDSLTPGGWSVWSVFKGEESRNPSIREMIQDVRREQSLAEAFNMTPWKLMDTAMLALSNHEHRFWTADGLSSMLSHRGFDVSEIVPAFNQCSWLALARKPEGRVRSSND